MINSKIHKFTDKFGFRILRTYPRPFERFAVKGNDLIGVEIGVFEGRHAINMLKTLSIKKLYLIDPYETSDEYTGEEMDYQITEAKQKAIYNLRNFDNIEWIFKKSEDSIHNVPTDLDFVYVDGNHEYKFVKRDVDNYYSRLKPGGVIGGHDITLSAVAKAVIEFAVENKLDLNIRIDDWWCIKK